MSKPVKIVLVILAIDILAAAAYFGIRALSRGSAGEPQDAYEWRTLDGSAAPQDRVEAYILEDSLQKGISPVRVRNFGQNRAVLRRFMGSRFPRPSPSVLNMAWPNLEDWLLLEIRYRNPDGREIHRTLLYVKLEGQWQVGDTGRLLT